MPLLVTVALSLWCWLGRGPYFLRWPLVVILVMITSGHSLGRIVSYEMESLMGLILPLLIMLGAGAMIFRGFRPRYRDSRGARMENYFGRDR